MRTNLLRLMQANVTRLGWTHSCADLLSEIWFDTTHGVRTIWPQETGCPDPCAVRYQGAVPRLVRRMLGRLPSATRDAQFLDIGAGKGRVLLLALEAGFGDVVGWEADPLIAARCAENLGRGAARFARAQHQVVVGDARSLAVPDRPFVAFLYNPFRGTTFRCVAGRLAASPHLLAVVYINPVELTLLLELGFELFDRVDQRGVPLACSLLPPRSCANAASAASRDAGRSTTALRSSWRAFGSSSVNSGNQRAR